MRIKTEAFSIGFRIKLKRTPKSEKSSSEPIYDLRLFFIADQKQSDENET